MATKSKLDNLGPTLEVARSWIDSSLIDDASLFAPGRELWTSALIKEVRTAFVDRPDMGDDNFITKFSGQLADCTAEAKQLAAEIMWALLLFPSNITARKKRETVLEIWGWSGVKLDPQHKLLSDSALRGIGSGGQAFNTLRPFELAYCLDLLVSLKSLHPKARREILTSYERFVDWIDGVPMKGKRQFRHMLRYFAFPDRVERMSSNRDRIAILSAVAGMPRSVLSKMPDRELDAELLKLRTKLQKESPGEIIDFYEGKLPAQWRGVDDDDPSGNAQSTGASTSPGVSRVRERPVSAEPSSDSGQPLGLPRNIIYYGPPGTGKTYLLQRLMRAYTDASSSGAEADGLVQVVSQYGWRPVVAAALARHGQGMTTPELRADPLVVAKARDRGREANILNTLWSMLQTHTPESVTAVGIANRRAPFIFDKVGDKWFLQPDWATHDSEAADLVKELDSEVRVPTKRFMLVTFHPSFSYEDFIRGIRPVSQEDGTTQFELVDGKFLQICQHARANPGKRYALFIDEINRANIAKVFGELITLIEPDKRAVYDENGTCVGGLEVELPGGSVAETRDRSFGVPANLDIIGTMNTADRSIALLDIALRRRFEFEEMEPRYDLPELQAPVDGIHRGRLLERINRRVEFLLDRDHRIGHAYLINANTLADLRATFRDKIIPLLREYFFDDLSRLALVLRTTGSTGFVRQSRSTYQDVFGQGSAEGVPADRETFEVTPADSWTPGSFRGIYLRTAESAALEMQG